VLASPRRRLAVLIASLALSAGLVACSSPSNTQDANAAFCTNATQLQTEMTKLEAMVAGGSATLDEVKTQAAKVDAVYEEVRTTGAQVAEAQLSKLEDANKQYEDAIKAIPSDATVDQAKAAYRSALVDYTAAVATAKSEVGC